MTVMISGHMEDTYLQRENCRLLDMSLGSDNEIQFPSPMKTPQYKNKMMPEYLGCGQKRSYLDFQNSSD